MKCAFLRLNQHGNSEFELLMNFLTKYRFSLLDLEVEKIQMIERSKKTVSNCFAQKHLFLDFSMCLLLLLKATSKNKESDICKSVLHLELEDFEEQFFGKCISLKSSLETKVYDNRLEKENKVNQTMRKNDQMKNYSKNWVSENCFYADNFSFENNCIKSNATEYSAIFGKEKLSKKFKYTFKIKSEFIGIGISDSENIDKGFLLNDFCYYFCEGKIYIDFSIVSGNQTFSIGDTVSILGDQESGTIEYRINDTCVYIAEPYAFKNGNKSWVPFIYFGHGGEVEIIDSFSEIETLPVFIAEEAYMWDSDLVREIHYMVSLDEKPHYNLSENL